MLASPLQTLDVCMPGLFSWVVPKVPSVITRETRQCFSQPVMLSEYFLDASLGAMDAIWLLPRCETGRDAPKWRRVTNTRLKTLSCTRRRGLAAPCLYVWQKLAFLGTFKDNPACQVMHVPDHGGLCYEGGVHELMLPMLALWHAAA